MGGTAGESCAGPVSLGDSVLTDITGDVALRGEATLGGMAESPAVILFPQVIQIWVIIQETPHCEVKPP